MSELVMGNRVVDKYYLESTADVSDCGQYRYSLVRVWDRKLPACMFIGLNPSTADASEDDPTLRRCVNFAQRWGYGKLVMCNLFAYRATKPNDMKAVEDPVGLINDDMLLGQAKAVDCVVAAWGNHGSYRQRDQHVKALLAQLSHLGLTKQGQPKHPLYVRGDTQLEHF